MTDLISIIIIIALFAFQICAYLWYIKGMRRYEWVYCRVTVLMTRRMREAMQALGIEEWIIDKVHQYMSSQVIPPYIPCPEPPSETFRTFYNDPYTVKEVAYRLSPVGAPEEGEWYCSYSHPYMAWRVKEVDSKGNIVSKQFHDIRNNRVSDYTLEEPQDINKLAEYFITHDFYFLCEFDRRGWKN